MRESIAVSSVQWGYLEVERRRDGPGSPLVVSFTTSVTINGLVLTDRANFRTVGKPELKRECSLSENWRLVDGSHCRPMRVS